MAGLLISLFLIAYVHAKRLPNIYWNSSNPIFDISNTDHVISAEIDDRVNIYCPEPTADVDGYEYSLIYMVSEDEYTHCVLLNPHLLGSCSNHSREISIGLAFRHYSPMPGGLKFDAGQSYYMISTSDGSRDGMDQKKGGLCLERQMKVKFEIHDRPGLVNPKFAARTSNKEDQLETTPVMYIIHNGDADFDVEPDAASDFSVLFSISLAIIPVYLFP